MPPRRNERHFLGFAWRAGRERNPHKPHGRDTTPQGSWPTATDLTTLSEATSITEISLLTPFVE